MKKLTRLFTIRTRLLAANALLLLVMGHIFVALSFVYKNWFVAEAIILAFMAVGLLVSYLMSHSIFKRLEQMSDWIQRIADGDLTFAETSQETKDEVGNMIQVLEGMLTNLGEMVGQITETALSVNSASNEILASNKRQEGNSTSQASAVEEIQRTMVSLLTSSRQITESTQTVFVNAEKTLKNNRRIAESIENLNDQTQRIAEILELIKTIADKSDLLALNASLEGTKAGEAGRGFSLVAAEMRKLAENVMGSVKDIKQLVGDIRKSSHASVMAAEEGMNLSTQTNDSARQIALITQQQQTGTEQVTQSMNEIRDLLNQTVIGSRESTEAAQELMQLSERLRVLVFNFKLNDDSSYGEETLV